MIGFVLYNGLEFSFLPQVSKGHLWIEVFVRISCYENDSGHRVGISEFELLNSNSEILQVFTLK